MTPQQTAMLAYLTRRLDLKERELDLRERELALHERDFEQRERVIAVRERGDEQYDAAMDGLNELREWIAERLIGTPPPVSPASRGRA